MVRLMLVLAPVMCILSGIGASALLSRYMKGLESNATLGAGDVAASAVPVSKKKIDRVDPQATWRHEISVAFVCLMTFFFVTYALHCTWVTSEAYSSPSIVLSARGHDGSRIIFDDFREAYNWLKHNTPEVCFRFFLFFSFFLFLPHSP